MEWNFDSGGPIYAQLVRQIERAVVTGVFPPGSKMPGVRELAAEAGVNPNTMQRALAELEAGGLLYTQRTSGRFVTGDEGRIAALRTGLAGRLSREYVRGMRALGLAGPEIDGFVADAKKEESL